MSESLPKNFFNFVLFSMREYKGWVFALFGCAFLAGSYGTINSYLMKIIIDNVTRHPPGEDLFNHTLIPAGLIAISYEVNSILSCAINYIKIKVAPSMRNHMINKLYSHVQQHSYSFFQNNFAGAIASHINKIAENVELNLHFNVLFIFRGVSQLLFALMAMYLVNPLFSVFLFIWTLSFLGIRAKFLKKAKRLSHAYTEANSQLSGKIIDSLSNLKSIKLFAREIFEVSYLKTYFNSTADKFRAKEYFLLKLSWLQGFSITVLMTVMVLTLLKLRGHNLVTAGDFALILGLALHVTESVWILAQIIDRLYDAIEQCNQGLNVIAASYDIKDSPNAQSLSVAKGEIVFHNVCFNYKGRHNLFNDLSVTIRGGQKIGLVGLSGSGKTTFVHLIARLFDVSSGVITIDGQNIAMVSQQSLRENIGFIAQDSALFHRSIFENIQFGNINANDEDILLSAKQADAHAFVTLLPEGYDTMVGENGMKFSGGQRQRLAISRVLLKNAPILILDEATGALDCLTEAYVQESLKEFTQQKTVIIITHRLSTLQALDRILVFEQGKIIEDGDHFELLAQNGTYANLWRTQRDEFLPHKIKSEELKVLANG